MKKSQHKNKLPLGFESIVECRNENNIRAKHLRMVGAAECDALALRLDGCTRWRPCGSGACRLCSRAVRKNIFATVKPFAASSNLPCHFVTIVFFQDSMTDSQLENWDPKALKARLRKQLHRVGLTCPVIGACELDYQSDIGLWMPHFHLLVFAERKEINVMRPMLLKKNRLGGLDRKLCPLQISNIGELDRLITYLYKFTWLDRKRFSSNSGNRTKKFRLSPSRHALALLTLDRLGFTSLMFSSGVQKSNHSLSMAFVSDKRQRRGC